MRRDFSHIECYMTSRKRHLWRLTNIVKIRLSKMIWIAKSLDERNERIFAALD